MDQASVAEVDIEVDGNIPGQFTVGNHNISVQNSPGAEVNVLVPSEQPAYQRKPSPVNFLPRSFPSHLDREQESALVKAAVQTTTPVAIYGEEGIGKTSFVSHLTHLPDMSGFPDGIVHIDALGIGLHDLLQALFDLFCESQPSFKPTDTEIRIAFQGLKALIFVDNLSLSRDEAGSLLNVAPESMFVLVSVQRSLWNGDQEIIPLHGLPEKDAFTLFERELDRSITKDEQAAVRELCTRLQGHPLRIVQAASFVRESQKPIAEIMEEVEGDIPEKIVLQLAVNHLTEPQRRVLVILAAGGKAAIPLEHLTPLLEDQDVKETLQRLEALGLIQSHSPRYSLTGDLAASLTAQWELTSWEDALVDYFIHWLEGQPPQSKIEESAEVILQTLKRAAERGRWQEVIHLGRAFERGLIFGKRWQAWADILNLILKAARAMGDRNVEAWALHQLGSRAMCLEQADQARGLLTEALKIRKAIKDKPGLKVTQHNLDVLIHGAGTPKGGNGRSGGRPWFMSGSAAIMAVLMSAMLTYVALSLTIPHEDLPFPGLPIYLFPTTTPTLTNTFTPTPTITLTLTATNTPTPTDTFTPTPTMTFTPTATYTPTPTATPILLPTLTGLKNANCRIGPSTSYDPPYGTLLQGQTVDILGVNLEGSWFLVEHPQSFRYPCWVWNGPAVQVNGDLSLVQVVIPPAVSKLKVAASEKRRSQSVTISSESPVPVDYCSLYPILCSDFPWWLFLTKTPDSPPVNPH